MKKLKIVISLLIVLVIAICVILSISYSKVELKTVSSKKALNRIYNNYSTDELSDYLISAVTMPWSLFYNFGGLKYASNISYDTIGTTDDVLIDKAESSNSVSSTSSSSKDYSTTNIQVENVDEADINKTDGDYIYSISENNVVITDVKNPSELKIASTISPSGIPQDLILYNNKLVVISAENSTSRYNNNTIVDIYNIENKESPKRVKNYKLYEPYYTSRCINNRLYIISSGNLRKEGSDIITYYTENNNSKDIGLKNIYYLKDVKSKVQTLISTMDLDNPSQDVNVKSYLIDISNAYISENSIYLLDQAYQYSYSHLPISSLFTWKGVIGPFVYEDDTTTSSNYTTYIYKFDIQKDGLIKYSKKVKTQGKTINQFSLDEYNGNLRVALYDNNGSKITVFNNNLEKIGETDYLAKGEKMYSSRFMGNKAYLVTYRTIDPLYVIDLSVPESPKVLGELKIPGYSTYLHPYDENHIIGIGMETKENVHRDSFGKITYTSASIVGMKMALFDVSDVTNPVQMSSTVIGDSRTTSSILTNHKALLFSKEKELIAIPVNNYPEDFEISTSSDNYSSIINSYTSYSKPYTSEGYLVYKINLTDGFKLKGTVTHDAEKSQYKYYTNSRLLRGLYIENNLFTISEDSIQVNNLENMEFITKINLRRK